MAGLASYNDFITALHTKSLYANLCNATVAITAGQHVSSWWLSPSRGATFGTALTARTLDNTFSAALPFRNPSGSNKTFLTTIGSGDSGGGGHIACLVDRLLEAPFDGTVTSGTFNGGTPLAIPARDEVGASNGAGCYMFLENANATTLTSQTMSVTYTNSGGTAGQSTGNFTVNAEGLSHLPTTDLFLPLATGDLGVRKIESYTLGGSIGGTQMNIVICRPIAVWYLHSNSLSKDLILGTTQLPRLYPGACMQFLYTASGGLGNLSVDLTMVEG